jgi:nucleotide-binding universal stress UspA family protein
MFNRILLPLDGSILAERAIPHAEQFARIFDASIVLLRVLEVTPHHENPTPIDPLSWQIRKTEADMYLRGVASRIREHLHGPERNAEDKITNEDRVEYAIREGRTAENIIDFAHNENIDLLVISSHGWGGLSRWNMSSIIQKVIDLIYLPLLIVRSYNLQGETNDRIHYRHILLPIDSSRRAECALSAGIVLAQGEALLEHAFENDPSVVENPSLDRFSKPDDITLEPKLFLAAVITPPEIPIPAPYPVAISKLSDQLLKLSRDAVRAYLSEMKLHLPVESEIRVVESNNVSTGIQELANQEDIDLILMSAHGYSGQFTQPYGRVTRNIIEHGTKSILVIQDVPRSQIRPTAAAVAADKSGRR